MEYHQGRLLDHVHLRVADLERSKRFYVAVLSALSRYDAFESNDESFWCDELYVDAKGVPTSGIHLAFQAHSRDAVHAFHEAGLRAGGTDNGQPGYRAYHGSYYAAFLLDPDGNNVEAVCDVGARRSGESVLITRPGDA